MRGDLAASVDDTVAAETVEDVVTFLDAVARLAALNAAGVSVRPVDVRGVPGGLKVISGQYRRLIARQIEMSRRIRSAQRLQWVAAGLGLVAGVLIGLGA